mmetsp:Transcript_67129/g.218542  ORF Transcript_67129/g.218542 Transcript_67129/m.218542 type:complete len:489 (+) Transcript_67129:92-1558(+)
MGLLGRLGCGCRHRDADGNEGGSTAATRAAAAAASAGRGTEAANSKGSVVQRLLEDPLMGAENEANAELAMELKEQGNDKYKRELFEEALQCYTEAVQLQPRNPSLWLNRSMTNRQLKQWEDAEEDAELASELQPDNSKAHYSRALCLQQLGKLEQSLKSCRAGLRVQPDNKALQQLQNVVKRTLAEPPKNVQQDQESDQSPPADGSSGSADGGSSRADRIKNGTARRRKRVLTAEDKERRRVSAASAQVDQSACPASMLKENDLHDIRGKAKKAMYQWKSEDPSLAERAMLKKMMTDMFKSKYEELTTSKDRHAASKKSIPTGQYKQEQIQGLQLQGGHQPMERPAHVDLPEKFQEPVGVLTLEKLKKYHSENSDRRYFISVYGNIFDVSDRPDKYGPDGPYTTLVGADITWGLFAGVDTPDYVNRFFDLFKAKDMGKDKIAGVCSWLAWYWNEYGEPVGYLDLYLRENELPEPPLEEVDNEACCVM